MRILVVSDLHRLRSPLERACEAQPSAKHVVFLGDGASTAEEISYYFAEKEFFILNGNCDFSSNFPTEKLLTIDGVKLFAAHGHTLSVKHSTAKLAYQARLTGASIALYGHTHVPKIEYVDGLYLVNPGSLSSSREGPESYAVIDITPAGIVPNIIKL